MKFVLELSWLWKSIAIIILVIAFCEICALLICKLMKRKFSKKTAIIIAVVATVATGLAIVLLSNAEFVKFKFIVYIKSCLAVEARQL